MSVTSIINIIYYILFIFLIQVVSLEKYGVVKSIKKSMSIFKKQPIGVVMYLFWRWITKVLGYTAIVAIMLVIGAIFAIPVYLY